MILDDRKKDALKKVYFENMSEALNAPTEIGQYRMIEFNIDLANNEVFHSLSVTNGNDVVIIQKDTMNYDKNYISNCVNMYAESGKITVKQVHDHSLDPVPSNTASLKTINDANNIVVVSHGEIEYVTKLSEDIDKIQKREEGQKLRYTTTGTNGVISALILAFIVGVFGGTFVMLLLNYILK